MRLLEGRFERVWTVDLEEMITCSQTLMTQVSVILPISYAGFSRCSVLRKLCSLPEFDAKEALNDNVV